MYIDPRVIRTFVHSETRRTGAPLHDDDLVQDAALRACAALHRQFEIRHPQAFLRKIVADAVRDHWRRRRVVSDLDSISAQQSAVAPRIE